MKKHAYLIIAHDQEKLLCPLLRLLDDSRNDIYVHIDKKSENISQNLLRSNVHHSRIFFTQRINVKWGAYSQIKCELILLTEAVRNGPYEYYHLLSGADLPIKTQHEIHAFFDVHRGTEFIQFQRPVISEKKKRRVQYYYVLQQLLQRKAGISAKFQEGTVRMQHVMGINRIRNSNLIFQMGSNWFSITEDCAEYILTQTDLIAKIFKNTKCCDELFIQTIVFNSKFKDQLYDQTYTDSLIGNERLIFWRSGAPRDINIGDFQMIEESECLFARKFNSKTDANAIAKVISYLNEKAKID